MTFSEIERVSKERELIMNQLEKGRQLNRLGRGAKIAIQGIGANMGAVDEDKFDRSVQAPELLYDIVDAGIQRLRDRRNKKKLGVKKKLGSYRVHSKQQDVNRYVNQLIRILNKLMLYGVSSSQSHSSWRSLNGETVIDFQSVTGLTYDMNLILGKRIINLDGSKIKGILLEMKSRVKKDSQYWRGRVPSSDLDEKFDLLRKDIKRMAKPLGFN